MHGDIYTPRMAMKDGEMVKGNQLKVKRKLILDRMIENNLYISNALWHHVLFDLGGQNPQIIRIWCSRVYCNAIISMLSNDLDQSGQ